MKDECVELGAIGGDKIEGFWVGEVMWFCGKFGKFGVDNTLGNDLCGGEATW